MTLKWNKGTTASGYQLQQYKDGKWVTIYTGTKATNTSYTVKNLKAGTATTDSESELQDLRKY
ncbi:MAG: hypothetical protein ACLS48_09470 [[Eubacterium] siraeum]